MKRFRLVDLPLIIKMGFAPAFALLMLAVLATGSIVVQRQQSAALQQVVAVDMRDNLRIQQLTKRIEGVHGELYLALLSSPSFRRTRTALRRATTPN